ncbi:hypothetical protein, partial [Necropsobacter massiliensis]|uniref:hypothetical protein n=1 Tax=Necropsobacter massiliensis TaxID=1400001 RepID=UPI001C5691CC
VQSLNKSLSFNFCLWTQSMPPDKHKMNFKLSTYQDFKIKIISTKSINKCPHRLSDRLLKNSCIKQGVQVYTESYFASSDYFFIFIEKTTALSPARRHRGCGGVL